MTLKVGQELWLVPREPRRRTSACFVTVKKIGRKWAEIDGPCWGGYRIDVNTLAVDGRGYTSPGQCYVDKAAWDFEALRQDTWMQLVRFMGNRYSPPEGVSTEDIKQAIRLMAPKSAETSGQSQEPNNG